jgi:hypothetical protein
MGPLIGYSKIWEMLWAEVISNDPQEHPRSPMASILAALIGFTGVLYFGAQWAPWPENFIVSVDVEHLEENGDQYDALYFGSSNVLRSFIPNVIDKHLDELGTPLRSFNVGGPGMLGYETDYVLRHVLGLEKTNPKYVIMEPDDWDPRPRGEGMGVNMLSTRGVYWHDWRQTLAALRGIVPLDMSPYEKAEIALNHLHAFCWNVSSYGEGLRILDNLRGTLRDQSVGRDRVAEGSGYQAIEELTAEKKATRRRTLTGALDQYAERVELINRDNSLPLSAQAESRIATPIQIGFIESKGAESLFVLPPSGIERSNALRLADDGVIRLLNYNDPVKYPEYYESANRFDPAHLNRATAVEFSRRFAEDFVQLLQSESDQ